MPYLFLPSRIAGAAQVSIEVATRAISLSRGFPFDYLRFKRHKDGRLIVDITTFGEPNVLGIRALLRDVDILARMNGMEMGSVVQQTWNTSLGKLELAGKESLIYRGTTDWIVMFGRLGAQGQSDGPQLGFGF